jgi:hypothetical protein
MPSFRQNLDITLKQIMTAYLYDVFNSILESF